MKRIQIIVIIISFGLISCNSKTIINEKVDLPIDGWVYENIPSFPFIIEDTSVCYDVSVNLQITDEYLYRNIYLLVHLRDTEGKDITDRVELELASNDGKWLGSGSSSFKSYNLPIRKDLCFESLGRYVIGFEQNMRDSSLLNIKYVGVSIAKGNPVF